MTSIPHLPVIIVGGGQAGLSIGACLKDRGMFGTW
jgi:putative flavoprotein involved in K+ transport